MRVTFVDEELDCFKSLVQGSVLKKVIKYNHNAFILLNVYRPDYKSCDNVDKNVM